MMYSIPSIKEELNAIIDNEPVSLNQIVKLITDFVSKIDNKQIIKEVFKTDEVEKMAEKLGLWKNDKEHYFGGEDEENNITVDELTGILTTTLTTNKLTKEEKEDFICGFADYFGECSEDEDFCENKIYVIIKNLSDNKDFVIKKEYNSWEDAQKDIDNTYIGCCDDAFIAENLWFQILCYLNDKEADEYKNFCSVVEFNAEGLEDAREYWEAENCEHEDE